MGGIYVSLRLWNDAERPELRALAMDPQNAVAGVLFCRSRLNGTGDIKVHNARSGGIVCKRATSVAPLLARRF